MKQKNQSRRQFLKGAASLGAGTVVAGCATTKTASLAPAPAAVAAPVVTAAPAVPPARRVIGANDRIRMATIGSGNRGMPVLNAFLARKDVDVVAITDAYAKYRARGVAACKKKLPDVAEYIRFEEMIEKEKLDAVHIATPDHIHAPAILAALDAGLDVYTEKPMCLSWEDAKAVRNLTLQTGAVLQVGTQLRSMPMYQRARDIVQNGEIGKLLAVRVNRDAAGPSMGSPRVPDGAKPEDIAWDVFLRDTQPYPLDAKRYFMWRHFLEYSNGVLGDLMCHHIDQCHFITGCGMPQRAMCVGGIFIFDDGRSTPDTVSTVLQYAEDFTFTYSTCGANGKYGLVEQYLGSDGTIEIDGMREMHVWRGDKEEVVPSAGILDQPHVDNFINAMRSRQAPIAPVEAGFQAATACRMALMSQQYGEAAKWDTRSETVVV
jgi:predicted dehydrogenase